MSNSSYRISQEVFNVLESRKTNVMFSAISSEYDTTGLWYAERITETLFYLHTNPYFGIYGTRSNEELNQVDEKYFNPILFRVI